MIDIKRTPRSKWFITTRNGAIVSIDNDRLVAKHLGLTTRFYRNLLKENGAVILTFNGYGFDNLKGVAKAYKALEPYFLAIKLRGEEI